MRPIGSPPANRLRPASPLGEHFEHERHLRAHHGARRARLALDLGESLLKPAAVDRRHARIGGARFLESGRSLACPNATAALGIEASFAPTARARQLVVD